MLIRGHIKKWLNISYTSSYRFISHTRVEYQWQWGLHIYMKYQLQRLLNVNHTKDRISPSRFCLLKCRILFAGKCVLFWKLAELPISMHNSTILPQKVVNDTILCNILLTLIHSKQKLNFWKGRMHIIPRKLKIVKFDKSIWYNSGLHRWEERFCGCLLWWRKYIMQSRISFEIVYINAYQILIFMCHAN